MRVCFFGSEEFSLPVVEAVVRGGLDLCCVVTKPDAPRGRGKSVSETVVAEFGKCMSVPVLKPSSLRGGEFASVLSSFAPDVAVVCSYGRILPESVLSVPRLGCVNVHPSMLPEYRGATPIETAIMDGRDMTGISIFLMDSGCDTGDLLLQREFAILPDDTRETLRNRMAPEAASLLMEALAGLEDGSLKPAPQASSGASLTRLISKGDLPVDWTLPSFCIANRIRALWPSPGARTVIRGKNILLGPARPLTDGRTGEPGTVLDVVKNEGVCVASGDGALLLGDLKPEGKRIMTSWQFACGCRLEKGEKIG